jgi:hypothetical protein
MILCGSHKESFLCTHWCLLAWRNVNIFVFRALIIQSVMKAITRLLSLVDLSWESSPLSFDMKREAQKHNHSHRWVLSCHTCQNPVPWANLRASQVPGLFFGFVSYFVIQRRETMWREMCLILQGRIGVSLNSVRTDSFQNSAWIQSRCGHSRLCESGSEHC